MKDSKYQTKIYKEISDGNGSLIIVACAGSGKTTTIVNSLKYTKKGTDKVFLAFNNTIIDELKTRIKDKSVNITTMHSICWKALMKHYNYKVELNKGKSIKHIEKFIKKLKIQDKRKGFISYNCSKLLDLVRQNMVDVDEREDVELLAQAHDLDFDAEIYEVLQLSLASMNKDYRMFDFTDMIYRAILDNVRMVKYDYVYVDEGQDLSKIQHAVIKKLIKPKTGRMIAVGDPRQAIYGFAGADSESFDNLRNLVSSIKELPLNVNYRCPRSVIKLAQTINPNIEACDTAEEGFVGEGSITKVKAGDWVLCRNVKPLVMLNLHLTSIGIKSFVKGKDIGFGLESYIKKLNCATLDKIEKKCDLEILMESSKLKRKGVKNPLKTEKIDRMMQRRDMIKILSMQCQSIKELIAHIKAVFKESGDGICLTTIHKSKGLENERIYFLCPELLPSKYAVMDWQKEQEENLEYVAITRAKEELIYVNDFAKIEKEIILKLK